jgi:hypothetical protein
MESHDDFSTFYKEGFRVAVMIGALSDYYDNIKDKTLK